MPPEVEEIEEVDVDEVVKSFIRPKKVEVKEPVDPNAEFDPDLGDHGRSLPETIKLLKTKYGGGEEVEDEEVEQPEDEPKTKEEPEDEPKAKKEPDKESEPEEDDDVIAAITFDDPAPAIGDDTPRESPKPKESEASHVPPEEREFIESLNDDEKFSLHFYSEAEQVDPKYKGLRTKQLEYLKKNREKIEELRKEDPHTPIGENPDYLAFVEQEQPKLSPWQVEEVRMGIATRRVRQEQQGDLQEIKAAQRRQEVMPEVERELGQFDLSLTGQLPEPMLKTFNTAAKEGGATAAVQKLSEEFPEETESVLRVYQEIQDEARAVIKTHRGVEAYDPSNPVHERAGSKIIEWEQQVKRGKGMEKYRTNPNGQRFATFQEYASMSPEERPKHFTLSTQQVLTMLAADGKKRMNDAAQAAGEMRNAMFKRWGVDPSTLKRRPMGKVTPDDKAPKKKVPKGGSAPAPGDSKPASKDTDPLTTFLIKGTRPTEDS